MPSHASIFCERVYLQYLSFYHFFPSTYNVFLIGLGSNLGSINKIRVLLYISPSTLCSLQQIILSFCYDSRTLLEYC